MPANGRWDLIQRLKVKLTSHIHTYTHTHTHTPAHTWIHKQTHTHLHMRTNGISTVENKNSIEISTHLESFAA